jgi:predicted metalloprotease with PDZ domain
MPVVRTLARCQAAGYYQTLHAPMGLNVITCLGRAVSIALVALAWPAIFRAEVAPPLDHAFRGQIELSVDARDTAHKVFRVHEVIPVQADGPVTLLYPEWELSSHAPKISAANMAGLSVQADGRPIAWVRDTLDMHAFHVVVPTGARRMDVDFQYVTRVDAAVLRDDLVDVTWQHLMIYPAGWFARNITVQPTLALPDGLQLASALPVQSQRAGEVRFAPATMETLLDTPVFAARYLRRLPLATSPTVQLDLMSMDPADLAISADDEAALKRLVRETRHVFGKPPYDRFDGLVVLDDAFPSGGFEHATSAEITLPANYLREPALQLNNRDLIAHEHVHAWNGRWRQPADAWMATPNVPTRNSLLWVYEGQTEFWGRVLAARSGMRTLQQTLDKLALDAASVQAHVGRAWKDLQDTTNDPIYVSGRDTVWPEWQRRKDYYAEGVMLWLDVQARLQDTTQGDKGMDDFARDFFAVPSKDAGVSTYTLDDVCRALARQAPLDWNAFLTERLHAMDARVLDGLHRLGWELVYVDTPSATVVQDAADAGVLDLSYSLGLSVDDKGTVRGVVWDGPAFKAGLAPGVRITQVDGAAFTADAMLSAVSGSRGQPVTIDFRRDGKTIHGAIDYHDGARYPSLRRITGVPDRLSPLLSPRT